MNTITVITAQEMQRLEALAVQEGASAEVFMENAAEGIAAYIEDLYIKKTVCIVVGKGNNGGDGYATGVRLLKKGYTVFAIQVFPDEDCSPLCLKQKKSFEVGGGKLKKGFPILGVDLVVDALVGTGFRGGAEGVLAEAICAINQSKVPIVSIDIPSGLDGTTGQALGPVVHATHTFYLGLPKLGFFLVEGWNCVGELHRVDFGLDAHVLAKARPLAQLVEEKGLEAFFPKIKRTQHKYDAGYVLACAGSPGMEGAAFLSSYASLRSGSGIVRLFYNGEMELGGAPFELIKEPFTSKRFGEELARARACLVGPGWGRDRESGKRIKKILKTLCVPSILDADALYFLAKHPRWKIPQNVILTPHKQEMHRLLGTAPTLDKCSAFAEKKQTTIVFKGAPTFIFHPGMLPHIIASGCPGMATAGMGDVLTGILAALLVQKTDPFHAAILGSFLHGKAGSIAESILGPRSLLASDLLECLPEAFTSLF